MRLIDADALLSQYTGDIFTAQIDYAQGMRDVIEDIKNAPTIEQERKKGRWIDIDSETYMWMIKCDKCGHLRSMMSTNGIYPKFCENCGADMRG